MIAKPDTYKAVAASVENWFYEFAREFPWRNEDTPWGRLVCEIMAQQTQISRVAKRWPQMMERFPTPEQMAKSDEQDVLSIWQGLGYYRRAKYLKAAAEMIVAEFDGEVPSDVDSLLKLPGVGKYTAGAIASIAFEERVPIVDGNVHRVLCRLANKLGKPIPDAWTWDQAKLLVESSHKPNICNEGLMELGATICTPTSPACSGCPIADYCQAYKCGTQDKVPAARKAKPKKHLHHHAVVLTCKGKIALEQRASTGLWASMWQVPTIESTRKMTSTQVAKKLGLPPKLSRLGFFDHTLTHRVISFCVFRCEIDCDERFEWHEINSLDAVPLANAQRKVLAVHCPT